LFHSSIYWLADSNGPCITASKYAGSFIHLLLPVQRCRFSPVKTKAEITGYPAGAICTPGSLPGIPPFWENISFTAISRLKFKTILA